MACYQDLVQFGNIGLVLAAWKYDYRKGIKFSTLAATWITHEIERSISLYARTVGLPENVLLEQLLISKTETRMLEELGRKPSNREVADKLGVPMARLLRMKQLKEDIISLDATLRDEGDMTLGDIIPGSSNVAGQVIRGINADIIREILQALPEKERYVLENRYGEKKRTLKEIGEEFNVSREAIRQREKVAKKKFREAMEKKKLTMEDLIG